MSFAKTTNGKWILFILYLVIGFLMRFYAWHIAIPPGDVMPIVRWLTAWLLWPFGFFTGTITLVFR